MSDKPEGDGLYIDSDWKEEAAREKERLVRQEEKERAKGSAGSAGAGATGAPPPMFLELVNLLAMQAAIGLGGYKGPAGESIPPNPAAARHHIALLEVLKEKTEGNLADDEKQALEAVLYELRMQYVQASSAPPAPSGQEKGKK